MNTLKVVNYNKDKVNYIRLSYLIFLASNLSLMSGCTFNVTTTKMKRFISSQNETPSLNNETTSLPSNPTPPSDPNSTSLPVSTKTGFVINSIAIPDIVEISDFSSDYIDGRYYTNVSNLTGIPTDKYHYLADDSRVIPPGFTNYTNSGGGIVGIYPELASNASIQLPNSYDLDLRYTHTYRGLWKVEYCVYQVYLNDLLQVVSKKETDCVEKSFTLKYKADGLAVARPFYLGYDTSSTSNINNNSTKTLKYNLDNVGTEPLASTQISLVVKKAYGTQDICVSQTQNHTFATPLLAGDIVPYSIPVNYAGCPVGVSILTTLCTSYNDLNGESKQACTSFQIYNAP